MPYNCKGDLYKIEIVKKLQNMGFDVKSVNALNKIMEKGVLNSDAWHPELVDEIAKYLKEK